MKSKIKKKIYDKLRLLVIREEFKNLGRVSETEDEFICYITPKRFDKKVEGYGPSAFVRRFSLKENPCSDKYQRLCDVYHIDKPIHYVFENIVFNVKPEIYSTAKKVTFRNCSFRHGIEIKGNSILEFENNSYQKFANIGSICCSGREIIFKNEMINVLNFPFRQLNLNLQAQEAIHFDNVTTTLRNSGSPEEITIETPILNMNETFLYADQMYIDAKEIASRGDCITAKDGICVDSKSTIVLNVIKNTPVIVYNGELVKDGNNQIIDSDIEISELTKLKQNLVSLLQELVDRCNYVGEQKRKALEEEILNSEVSKILKLKK